MTAKDRATETKSQMPSQAKFLDGYTLAGHLGKYAETGYNYVKLIRSIIRGNGLKRADIAKLADGPQILFRRTD
jgi:hypothetical protein